MSTDLVTAIGRLLSDPLLRERFADDPQLVAKELQIAAGDIATFIELDAQQLNAQSQQLIDKRWHEARRFLPANMCGSAASSNEAKSLFEFYATRHWPTGHDRHKSDARDFLKFLKANQIQP